jgi:fumarylacetoacetase
MSQLNETHDPQRLSWVASANRADHDFPLQNLPFGVFSLGREAPRGGIAIGDFIVDLAAGIEAGLFSGAALKAARQAATAPLNGFLALGGKARQSLRQQLFTLLAAGTAAGRKAEALAKHLLVPMRHARLHLPCTIGDYTDFYASVYHATNVGRLFRPDAPLLPNYKHVPIGYHGRASSIMASGASVRRPKGQRKAPDAENPDFGPSRRLDYETELGIWIGPGNRLGETIPIEQAAGHIAGYCLLNDWSARDIQAWEYQPLGPFLAKNFISTVSPWIVTPEALVPFRIPAEPRVSGDPKPLPYLDDAQDQAHGGLAIALETLIETPLMREKGLNPHRLALGNSRHLYWTPAQFVAHHTSGGCNLNPGDLFGSGTASGPTPDSLGCLLELTQGGKAALSLPSGETRTFLEDGDSIILRGFCEKPGAGRIGFGSCVGTVIAA